MEVLLPTVLGGLLAILGGVVGQFLQSRHSDRVRAADARRENRYRLYEQRLKVYEDFHIAAGPARVAMSRLASKERGEHPDPDLLEARSGVWHAYVRLGLIGQEPVVRRARDLFNYVDDVVIRRGTFDSERWASLIRAYGRSAREHALAHERDAPAQNSST